MKERKLAKWSLSCLTAERNSHCGLNKTGVINKLCFEKPSDQEESGRWEPLSIC